MDRTALLSPYSLETPAALGASGSCLRDDSPHVSAVPSHPVPAMHFFVPLPPQYCLVPQHLVPEILECVSDFVCTRAILDGAQISRLRCEPRAGHHLGLAAVPAATAPPHRCQVDPVGRPSATCRTFRPACAVDSVSDNSQISRADFRRRRHHEDRGQQRFDREAGKDGAPGVADVHMTEATTMDALPAEPPATTPEPLPLAPPPTTDATLCNTVIIRYEQLVDYLDFDPDPLETYVRRKFELEKFTNRFLAAGGYKPVRNHLITWARNHHYCAEGSDPNNLVVLRMPIPASTRRRRTHTPPRTSTLLRTPPPTQALLAPASRRGHRQRHPPPWPARLPHFCSLLYRPLRLPAAPTTASARSRSVHSQPRRRAHRRPRHPQGYHSPATPPVPPPIPGPVTPPAPPAIPGPATPLAPPRLRSPIPAPATPPAPPRRSFSSRLRPRSIRGQRRRLGRRRAAQTHLGWRHCLRRRGRPCSSTTRRVDCSPSCRRGTLRDAEFSCRPRCPCWTRLGRAALALLGAAPPPAASCASASLPPDGRESIPDAAQSPSPSHRTDAPPRQLGAGRTRRPPERLPRRSPPDSQRTSGRISGLAPVPRRWVMDDREWLPRITIRVA